MLIRNVKNNLSIYICKYISNIIIYCDIIIYEYKVI